VSTTDEVELAETRRRELDARRQAEEDLVAVMRLPAGRRWVWRLLEQRTGIHNGSYVYAEGGNGRHDAHLEGRRAVGLELLLELQRVCRVEYLLMVDEGLDALRRALPE
jgi:hypothetical protein